MNFYNKLGLTLQMEYMIENTTSLRGTVWCRITDISLRFSTAKEAMSYLLVNKLIWQFHKSPQLFFCFFYNCRSLIFLLTHNAAQNVRAIQICKKKLHKSTIAFYFQRNFGLNCLIMRINNDRKYEVPEFPYIVPENP